MTKKGNFRHLYNNEQHNHLPITSFFLAILYRVGVLKRKGGVIVSKPSDLQHSKENNDIDHVRFNDQLCDLNITNIKDLEAFHNAQIAKISNNKSRSTINQYNAIFRYVHEIIKPNSSLRINNVKQTYSTEFKENLLHSTYKLLKITYKTLFSNVFNIITARNGDENYKLDSVDKNSIDLLINWLNILNESFRND